MGDGGVDDFQFIMLFPRAAQPCLGPLANFGYGLSLLCGLCKDREVGWGDERAFLLGLMD